MPTEWESLISGGASIHSQPETPRKLMGYGCQPQQMTKVRGFPGTVDNDPLAQFRQ